MLVRLELLKMARDSLPFADIDDGIAAAEKFAAFVEEDGKPTVEGPARVAPVMVFKPKTGTTEKPGNYKDQALADPPTTDEGRSEAELDRAVDFITSPPAPEHEKPADPAPAARRKPCLTDKQKDFYRAIEKRIESGELFVLADIGDDMGVTTTNAYAFSTAIQRKGFMSVQRHGGAPSTYALLKTIDGKAMLPKVSGSNAVEKPAPKPPVASKPTNTVVSPVNQHLVRAARPVSLNTPGPAKQEPPAYDESMVRRFEPKSRDQMIRETLEEHGYTVETHGSANWTGVTFIIDGKKFDLNKAIELADEIRLGKKLEPIGKAGAA